MISVESISAKENEPDEDTSCAAGAQVVDSRYVEGGVDGLAGVDDLEMRPRSGRWSAP